MISSFNRWDLNAELYIFRLCSALPSQFIQIMFQLLPYLIQIRIVSGNNCQPYTCTVYMSLKIDEIMEFDIGILSQSLNFGMCFQIYNPNHNCYW